MSTQRHGATIVMMGLVLLAACGGCRRSADDADLAGGTLVFEDAFDEGGLSDRWVGPRTRWAVEDGQLVVSGARNDALWLEVPLPDRVRIEFDATSRSEEGDIKFEVFGDGRTHESGYIGIFGGWNNRVNVIARLDEHGDDRQIGAAGVQVEPGRVYRNQIVRTDGTLRWYVDGSLFLRYVDPAPLAGEGHDRFGFNNWNAPLAFDNVRVYDLGTAP